MKMSFKFAENAKNHPGLMIFTPAHIHWGRSRVPGEKVIMQGTGFSTKRLIEKCLAFFRHWMKNVRR